MNLWRLWNDLGMWSKFGLAFVAAVAVISIIVLLISPAS